MPVKKKSRSSSAKSQSDHAGPTEPVTMMTEGQPGLSPSKGGKKKKKKKMSAAEKAQARLDKAADDMKRSGKPLVEFISRIENWLSRNQKRAMDLFKMVDLDAEEALTYEEFKSAMLDLGAPCNAVELHLLAQICDRHGLEEVEYLELIDGLKIMREQEEDYREEDVRPQLSVTNRNLEKCPICKMASWDGESYQEDYPRYIEVIFRLATFDNFKGHPGHFSKVVHSHITVHSLLQIIKDHTQVATTQLALFTDKSRDPDSMLAPAHSLEECGFTGHTRDHPTELLLFYDYKVEFTECPLLMCDHYFGQKQTIS